MDTAVYATNFVDCDGMYLCVKHLWKHWNLVFLQYFLLCNSPLAQHTSRIINTHREVVGTATGRPD